MYLKILLIYYVVMRTDANVVNKTDDVNNKTEIGRIQDTLPMKIIMATLKNRQNTVVSTLSLQLSLCKLASVATGAAKDKLMKALGFTKDEMIDNFYANVREELLKLQQTDLTHINEIYLDYKSFINTSFAENSTLHYGVRVDKVSYMYPTAATTFINRAVSTATYRRVEDIIQPKDINNLTSIALIYAAHFKPTWEKPFDQARTRKRKFYASDKNVIEVPMMAKTASFLLYDYKDFMILSTRLSSPGATMTFVLPTFVNMEGLLNRLQQDPDLFKKAKKLMKWQEVTLVMPSMKIKCQHDIIEYLRQAGIKEILDRNSTGLNAILNEGAVNASNLYVSKIKQKLFLQVDEFGVYRVNKALADLLPHPMEPPGTAEVVLDRPFFFTVSLEPYEAEPYDLFSGVFYRPE